MFLERAFEVLDFCMNLNIRLDLQIFEFSCCCIYVLWWKRIVYFLSDKYILNGHIGQL